MSRLYSLPVALAIGLIFTEAAPAGPQSISDAVKQEKKRQAQTKAPGKVYTNQDLDRAKAVGSVSTSNLSPPEPEWRARDSAAAGPGINVRGAGRDSSDWLSGAGGYESAIQEHRRRRRPVVLYFYTDWCGYCRQFDRAILTSDTFKQYMKDVISIRINPETGPGERVLAKQYGVTGYPSFFVLPGGSDRAQKMSPYRREGRQWVRLSPDLFVQACKQAARD